VIVQHLAYFQCQDGDLLVDVIDQCVLDSQTSHVINEPVFYDAHEPELGMPPEDTHPPTSSGPTAISKREPNHEKLRPLFGWSSTDLVIKKDL
jgi:hypothetical protein